MIMTRPDGANEDFVASLAPEVRVRLEIIFSPLIAIVSTGAHPEVGPNEGVIFTSANGVKFAPAGNGRVAFCVGGATTAAAIEAGWDAEHVAPEAAGLVAELRQKKPGMRLHHLCGVHARGQVAEKLQQAGLDACRIAVYDQQLLPLNERARQAIESAPSVLVPLFSPRTAGHFAQQCTDPTRIHVIALSAAIADNLGELAVASLEIADHPTSQEVCAILEKLILSDSLG